MASSVDQYVDHPGYEEHNHGGVLLAVGVLGKWPVGCRVFVYVFLFIYLCIYLYKCLGVIVCIYL